MLTAITDTKHSTDAGQFAMIESVTTTDKKVEFEFVAAVPLDKDISKYENGIGPLDFERISIIAFPGELWYRNIVLFGRNCIPLRALSHLLLDREKNCRHKPTL